jgi:hypothetical protein
MNTNVKQSARTLSKVALLQGFAFIFLSLFAGAVCPSIASMLQDPESPTSWQASFLFGLKWYWTLPVGIALAGLIILISSKLPETAKAIFALITGLALLAFAVFLSWLMLSM